MNSLTEAPVIFLAFAMGETASPKRSVGECGGGKTSPKAKALENKGLKCGSEKKCPMPVNGYKKGGNSSKCSDAGKVWRGQGGFVMSDFEHFLQTLGEAERPEVAFV